MTAKLCKEKVICSYLTQTAEEKFKEDVQTLQHYLTIPVDEITADFIHKKQKEEERKRPTKEKEPIMLVNQSSESSTKKSKLGQGSTSTL